MVDRYKVHYKKLCMCSSYKGRNLGLVPLQGYESRAYALNKGPFFNFSIVKSYTGKDETEIILNPFFTSIQNILPVSLDCSIVELYKLCYLVCVLNIKV